MAKRKWTKEQMIYETLHIKLKIDQHELSPLQIGS
jgi:hypothetical protein